jgi:hypothetical protein
MKHVLNFGDFLSEGLSKINPGKKIITAGLAGSPTAASYVKAAQSALEKMAKIAEGLKKARKKKDKEGVVKLKEAKKALIEKLVELKKQAKGKYGEEMKKIKAEAKQSAAKKAPQVKQKFDMAIKNQEDESEKESPKMDTEKMKAEMDKIKEDMEQMWDDHKAAEDKSREEFEKEMEKEGFSYQDYTGDNGWGSQFGTDKYEAWQEEWADKGGEVSNKIDALAAKYEELEKQIEEAEGKNESYVWEAVDRLLEFDAQAFADKAKEKTEKREETLQKFQDKKSEEGGDDEVDKKIKSVESKMKRYQSMSDDEQGSRKGQELMGEIEDGMEAVKDMGGSVDWPEKEDGGGDDEEEKGDYEKEKRLKKEIEELKKKMTEYQQDDDFEDSVYDKMTDKLEKLKDELSNIGESNSKYVFSFGQYIAK